MLQFVEKCHHNIINNRASLPPVYIHEVCNVENIKKLISNFNYT